MLCSVCPAVRLLFSYVCRYWFRKRLGRFYLLETVAKTFLIIVGYAFLSSYCLFLCNEMFVFNTFIHVVQFIAFCSMFFGSIHCFLSGELGPPSFFCLESWDPHPFFVWRIGISQSILCVENWDTHPFFVWGIGTPPPIFVRGIGTPPPIFVRGIGTPPPIFFWGIGTPHPFFHVLFI